MTNLCTPLLAVGIGMVASFTPAQAQVCEPWPDCMYNRKQVKPKQPQPTQPHAAATPQEATNPWSTTTTVAPQSNPQVSPQPQSYRGLKLPVFRCLYALASNPTAVSASCTSLNSTEQAAVQRQAVQLKMAMEIKAVSINHAATLFYKGSITQKDWDAAIDKANLTFATEELRVSRALGGR
ncbi:MAG: hypothetical protein WAZ18_01790 [Alphaproteobacteria bacterium]